MSFTSKLIKFCNDNVVLIAGGAIIVGVHWGWSKLQENPALVPPNERKDLPIVIGAKALVDTIKGEYDHLAEEKKVTTTNKT